MGFNCQDKEHDRLQFCVARAKALWILCGPVRGRVFLVECELGILPLLKINWIPVVPLLSRMIPVPESPAYRYFQ